MKSERMTVPEQTRPRRARSKVRTYSYKTPDGHVCVDCYECALNPNGKYSEVGLPLVPICHIVGILSMGGHRIVRRGQRGCVNGWLGKGLVARSWEEYTRQVGEEAWDRLLRKAPKGVRKNMEKYKERVIAAFVAKRTGGEAPRAEEDCAGQSPRISTQPQSPRISTQPQSPRISTQPQTTQRTGGEAPRAPQAEEDRL